MKRLLIPALLLVAIAIPTAFAQNRMTYSVVSPDNGHVALGLAIRKLNVVGHLHAGAGASRRRDQRAVRAVHARHGPALDRRAEQPRRRRAERDRPGAVPRHRRAAHRRAARGASDRRRGAVLHARDRLRLLVRSRGSHQQVGARRDRRRLRAADSHAAARRARDDEHPGTRRRSRARGDDRAGARGVSRRGRSGEVSRAAARGAAAVAAAQAVLQRRRAA